MPWPLRLFAGRREAHAAGVEMGLTGPPVGAMWPIEVGGEDGAASVDQWIEWYTPLVARRYIRDDKAHRLPMFVKLPDGTEFCIDHCASTELPAGGEGWGCTGTPPDVTLSPSINVVGRYHGWIQNGVITDDCEGRTFPNAKGFA